MSFKSDIAKTAAGASRFILQKILKRDGGFFPGKIALKFNPELLEELAKTFDAGTVLVTGTNGKTSVTALVASCMEFEGAQVSTNKTGANLASGIASAILDFKPKRRKNHFGVFEIDELWVANVLPQMKSKYLLLLNLFPDQIDRFGSIDKIQKSLVEALNNSPQTVLVYNADDPNCQIVADECENNTIPFGVEEKISHTNEAVKQHCPICSFDMNYKIHQYAQLGVYRCPSCGFNRANVKYGARDVRLDSQALSFKIKNINISTKKAAEYVCYNMTGFIALVQELGCHPNSIEKAVKTQNTNNGRMQFFEFGEKEVMINLAKNPVGFNQNINFIVDRCNCDDRPQNVAVAFFANTREGDGKDPSWIHEVNFSHLADVDFINVYFGGEAFEVLAEAFKKAGIPAHRIENVKALFEACPNSKDYYIIANYTAMFPLREELLKLQQNLV